MSESKSNSQQTIVIALVAIAVLLAALVGVIIFQQMQASKLAAANSTNAATGADAGAGTSPQMPTPAPATAFDPKTATKVPASMTPAQFVKVYGDNVVAGKFDEAYKMLPIDSQKTYGSASAYGAQLKGYGITGHKTGAPTGSGDTMSIAQEEDNPAMPITYTWNFKKVGNQWYVASRSMGGSVQ